MSTLSKRHTTVVLFEGDDLARIEELLEEVASAVASGGPGAALPKTLDDISGDGTGEESDAAQEAARRYDEFVTEATARATKVRVEALGRTKWRGLVGEHPPRMTTETVTEGGATTKREVVHPDDRLWRFNSQTMGDVLVPASVTAITSPHRRYDTVAEREDFIDGLSDPDFNKLYSAAVRQNIGGGPDPKADMLSKLSRISSETSE